MILKQETVYTPAKNKSDFKLIDPLFGELNANVKTGYFLSEQELIDLLYKAWDESRATIFSPVRKDQLIKNLLKQ